MDRAELARILGLGEDATDEDIKNKLGELNKPVEVDLSKLDVSVDENGKLVATHPDFADAKWEGDVPAVEVAPVEENDNEKELAKLAETNPTLATFLSEHGQLKEDVKGLKAVTRLSEVTTQLTELSDGKQVLPPVAADKFRDVMVQLPKQLSDAVADGLKELVKVGFVQLGEVTPQGKGDGKLPVNDNAINIFLSEVDRVQAEYKEKHDRVLSTRKATEVIQRTKPQMYSDYVDAVDSGQRLTEEV